MNNRGKDEWDLQERRVAKWNRRRKRPDKVYRSPMRRHDKTPYDGHQPDNRGDDYW